MRRGFGGKKGKEEGGGKREESAPDLYLGVQAYANIYTRIKTNILMIAKLEEKLCVFYFSLFLEALR